MPLFSCYIFPAGLHPNGLTFADILCPSQVIYQAHYSVALTRSLQDRLVMTASAICLHLLSRKRISLPCHYSVVIYFPVGLHPNSLTFADILCPSQVIYQAHYSVALTRSLQDRLVMTASAICLHLLSQKRNSLLAVYLCFRDLEYNKL